MGSSKSKHIVPLHQEYKDDDDDSDIPDQLHLLQSGDESDITLVCGGQSFNVHSHILSARSDAFRTIMLDNGMKCLRVTDICPSTLENILQFIYSGEIPSMSMDASMKFYDASDKYLIEPLRRKCKCVIINQLKGKFHEVYIDDDDYPDFPNQLHLYQSADRFDMTLFCGDQLFNVHSHILSTRSDAFKTLLLDNVKKCVHITDTCPSALEKMLHFIYSGEVPSMSVESAMKVYEASEIYLIESLKRKCRYIIENKLNEITACDILVFSNRLRETSLKDSVITYLISRKSFLLGQHWRRFTDMHPKLATEVHLAYIRRT